MKKFVLDFLRRGLSACGLGPIVLAIIYLVLEQRAGVETLTIKQACTGILSISALAFVAGAINAIYQIEKMPLMVAILLHGGVLYFCYLGTYLLNDWLERGTTPLLAFTSVFILGYLAIWLIIYAIMKRRTEKINAMLKKKQQKSEEK